MDVILELQKFGLTNIEAEVYHELLKSPNSNGSQISKKIDNYLLLIIFGKTIDLCIQILWKILK